MRFPLTLAGEALGAARKYRKKMNNNSEKKNSFESVMKMLDLN